jgi:hypothetical protein
MSTKEHRQRIELLPGTLDLLISRAVLLVSTHGHAIAKANSQDVLQVEQGALGSDRHFLN